jgi:hypothetical protein
MSEDTGFQFTDDAVPKAYEEVLVPRLSANMTSNIAIART